MSDNFMRVRKGLIVTPGTLPSSGQNGAIAVDTANRFKRWNGSAWVDFGTGGAGEKNYLQINNKGYNGEETTGWSTYKDAAARFPVDGTGGTATVISALSTTTTSPLEGARSFRLIKGSGNAQGEGWSVDFTIDREDLAKILNIRLSYRVVSGTFNAGGFTTAASDDSSLIVYIYDIDNNVLIQPTSFKLFANATNIADMFQGSFQTSANGLNYRLILHVARTETAAWELMVDSISVSPSKYISGTPITDWVEYTPNFNSGFTVGTGSLAYSRWYWRRVGDTCQIQGSFRLGTSPSMGTGGFRVSIPPFLSIDPNRMSGNGNGSNGANFGLTGFAFLFDGDSGTGDRELYNVSRDGDSSTLLRVTGRTDAGATGEIGSSFPFTWATGDQFFMKAEVPIQGWSSSVRISEPMEFRDVHVYAVISTFSVVSSSSYVKVPFDHKFIDTTNSYNTSTRAFTAPTSGYYLVNCGFTCNGTSSLHVRIYVNGVGTTGEGEQVVVTDPAKTKHFSAVKYLRAGDTLDIRVFDTGTVTFSGSSATDSWSHLQITRLSSSQVLAQDGVVAMRATNTSGQSISHATTTQITNWTKTFDTHNCFDSSTGEFTVPVSGFYKLTGAVFYVSPAAVEFSCYFKNITTSANYNTSYLVPASTSFVQIRVQDCVKLNAGEKIALMTLHFSGSARSLGTVDIYNLFCVEKIY